MKSHRLFVPQSMIPAMLSGAKTQHRIPLKRQPPDGETLQVGIYHPTRVRKDGEEYPGPATFGCWTPDGDWALPCLYQPGDEVWVPEDFYIDHGDYSEGGRLPTEPPPYEVTDTIYFIADATSTKHWCCEIIPECQCGTVGKPGVRPAAMMPRWASRFVLTVTDVRVERVQDITEYGAIEEGMEYQDDEKDIGQGWMASDRTCLYNTAKRAYQCHWDATHGPGAWTRNDWVWVPTFTVKEITR